MARRFIFWTGFRDRSDVLLELMQHEHVLFESEWGRLIVFSLANIIVFPGTPCCEDEGETIVIGFVGEEADIGDGGVIIVRAACVEAIGITEACNVWTCDVSITISLDSREEITSLGKEKRNTSS